MRLSRHTHTPKCNESAKIGQIINCGLTILIVSVFPVLLTNYDTAQICRCWQNGGDFYKTHLATVHMSTKRTNGKLRKKLGGPNGGLNKNLGSHGPPRPSLRIATGLDILGFTDFRPVLFVTTCHTQSSSQISHLCRVFFWEYSFSRHLRFMTTGEDRNEDRLKIWKLFVFWKLPFRHHGPIKLTQNCVCFLNPCFNRFVPTFVTREYHPKVLERLHLL